MANAQKKIFFVCLSIGSKNTTVEAGIQRTTDHPEGTDPDEDKKVLDEMYLFLDPHLRPATPDGENPQSMALFEDHKQLAQEYFKVCLICTNFTQHCE